MQTGDEDFDSSFKYMSSPFDSFPIIHDLGEHVLDLEVPFEECDEEVLIEENTTTNIVLRSGTFPPGGTQYQGINLSAYLCHSKRSPKEKGQPWDEVTHFKRSTMKKGEYVRIELGPNNLKRLFFALLDRYRDLGGLNDLLRERKITAVNPELVTVLEGNEHEAVKVLIERDPDFWKHIQELDTANVLQNIAVQKEHEKRCAAIDEFQFQIERSDWEEEDWQKFFSSHEWIFGYGLSYRYVRVLQEKAEVGGRGVDRKGADQVDYLLASEADVRFTVLVDIKKPDSPLLARLYRGNIYRMGKEVVGGSTQLQSYLHNWKTSGSQSIQNRPETLGAFTYDPKGVLVVGHTNQLDDDHRKKSFELFRSNIHNPQIVTFDELLERAKAIVSFEDPFQDKLNRIFSNADDDYDDVPF